MEGTREDLRVLRTTMRLEGISLSVEDVGS